MFLNALNRKWVTLVVLHIDIVMSLKLCFVSIEGM